jgi:hypothetical protein
LKVYQKKNGPYLFELEKQKLEDVVNSRNWRKETDTIVKRAVKGYEIFRDMRSSGKTMLSFAFCTFMHFSH